MPNPFAYGPRVSKPDRFIGRAVELERIFAALDTVHTGKLRSVSIVGSDRVGKSSLLYQLTQIYRQRLAEPDRYVFVYADLQAAKYEQLDSLLKGLLSGLRDALPSDAIILRQQLNDSINGRPISLAEFETAIHRFSATSTPPLYPVICLDEFERLVEHTAEFPNQLYNSWCSLMNENYLGLVIASSRPLIELSIAQGITSPFFSTFSDFIRLSELTEEEAREFISQGQTCDRPFTEYDCLQALNLAGRHPLKLQLAGKLIYEAKGEPKTNWKAIERDYRQTVSEIIRPLNTLSTLHLLYWVFFKPLSLEKYILSFDQTLGRRKSLITLWRCGKEHPPLRQLFWRSLFNILITPWILYVLGISPLLLAGTPPPHFVNSLFSLAAQVALVLALGLLIGLMIDMAIGLAFSLAFALTLDIAMGLAVGLAVSGVGPASTAVLSMVVSTAFGIASGLVIGVIFGVALGAVFGMVASFIISLTFGVLFGIADGPLVGFMAGLTVGLTLIFSYFRLYFYLPELALQWLLTRRAGSNPGVALRTWRISPIHYDELIWPPLLGLDMHLISIALANRETGAKAIAEVAGSFRQGWAARNALLEITARDVEGAKDITSIANVAEVLAWLPTELPRALESFLPALRQIAERVRAALESEDNANRLDQLQRAHTEVVKLQHAEAWGKSAKAGARFARALRVWQTVLNTELSRLMKEVGQLTLPNVYVAGSPLADQSRVFKGRRDLFNMLERELAAQPEARPALLLLGPRRSGKTSTLRQLPSRLGPDFAPVEVDLLSAVTSENAAGLLGGIAEQIRDKALLTRRLKLPRLDKTHLTADPYLAFLQWLTDAEAHLDGKLILLNLDEYERLEEMIAKERLDARIFQWLRSLIQSHPGVVVLLSGSHAPEELAPAWSDALINVRALRLGPLAEPDARELITAPVPDFPLQYEPEAVEMILQATGRQPYLIQATCRDLVNHLNEERRLSATRADVEAAFDSALQTGAVYFNELWTSADTDDAQRAALRLLAQNDWLSESDLTRRAQLSSLTPLKKLIGRDLIEQVDGGYRLRAGLVGRWIRRMSE